MTALWVIAAVSVAAVLAAYIAFRRSAAELDRRGVAFDAAIEARRAERDALFAASEQRSRERAAETDRWLAEVEREAAADRLAAPPAADLLDEIEAELDYIQELIAEARRDRRPSLTPPATP